MDEKSQDVRVRVTFGECVRRTSVALELRARTYTNANRNIHRSCRSVRGGRSAVRAIKVSEGCAAGTTHVQRSEPTR